MSNRKNPDLRDYYFFGGAFDYAITKPLHFVAEFTGNEHPEKTQKDQYQSLYGVTYAVSKNVILDATYKKGFGPSSPDWGFGVGVAIEF